MSYAFTILSLVGLNALFALSVYITFAIGQFSLAQVGFWALGAYGTAILTTLYGWPLWGALATCAAGCAVISIALGYPCLRLKGFYLALATLGFSETVRVVFQNLEFQVLVNGIQTGPAGVLGFRRINVATTIYDIFGCVLVLVALLTCVKRTRVGLAMDATREDETVAKFMGVNTVMAKVAAFMVAAALAALGGGLYAGFTSYISADDFGFHMTLMGILFVAIGGSRTLYGPMLAAAVLTVLPETIRFLAEYRMIFYGLLVLVLMTVRPRGLIDKRFMATLRNLGRRRPSLPVDAEVRQC